MDLNFWAGKRVLVTGHTGFKGGWLSLWLQQLGAEVCGYALAPATDRSLLELARVAAGMQSITADIRDLDQVEQAFARHRPEIVIHLAAQALVHTAHADPVRTYTTNVIGTMNLLEAARRAPDVRVLVCITSDKCYENLEWVWGYRENDRLGGHDPYSASKACAEHVIASYRDSFFAPEAFASHGVAVASARAGNVIGGGDWSADRLIPDIIQAIMAERPVRIRQPQSTRPWQLVLEPLSGYLELAEHLWRDGPAYAESWNFGPSDQRAQPVAWIVRQMTELWGEGASWELDQASYPREDTFLKLDCSKASARLGWQCRLDLHATLAWTMEWYRAYQRGDDMHQVTLEQIDRYQQLL